MAMMKENTGYLVVLNIIFFLVSIAPVSSLRSDKCMLTQRGNTKWSAGHLPSVGNLLNVAAMTAAFQQIIAKCRVNKFSSQMRLIYFTSNVQNLLEQ